MTQTETGLHKAFSQLMNRLFNRRLFNAALRTFSLGTKLLFSLYMGRYLGLSEMGVYGLVTAAVAIMVAFLGMRFDYVVTRDIVGAAPLKVACRMRDQALFYGISYLFLIIVAFLASLFTLEQISTKLILYIVVLAITESFASTTYGNMISLGRPILANLLFFVRSALWVIPVILLGIMNPEYRTALCILNWWCGGVVFCQLLTLFFWRHLPWRETLKTPVDRLWIRNGIKKSVFIWLGTLGLTGGAYIDRFVINYYLGLDYVGIASFYGSFVLALSSLTHSGVFSFTYPKLIAFHKENDHSNFTREKKSTMHHAALFAGLTALAIGLMIPPLGKIFHRPEFGEHAVTLWLMLLGVWIKLNADMQYYVLFARRQDTAIWVGDLAYLLPALGGNALLVPLFGFNGIGYAAILSAIFLFIWRSWHVKNFSYPQPSTST